MNLPPLTFLLLCETILDDWSDSGNFSVWSHLPLIQKDSVTHIHKLAVYMKEGFPFAQNLSLPKSADSYLCFQQDLLHSVPCFCLSITSLVFRWCYVRSGVQPIDSAMKWTDFTPKAEQNILQTKKLSYLIFSLYILFSGFLRNLESHACLYEDFAMNFTLLFIVSWFLHKLRERRQLGFIIFNNNLAISGWVGLASQKN